MNAAIVFEPNGYLVDGPKLMGRQVAGNGFLRAAVAARGGQPVVGVTPLASSATAFRRAVHAIDPTAQSFCISPARQDAFEKIGVLYRPDHYLAGDARHRLRVGLGAYSICGVTHTLSTPGTLAAFATMAIEPLAPWDALICTSTAAKSVVETMVEIGNDHLAWRLGHRPMVSMPLLPIIPLGVHCSDFEFSAADRAEARKAFGLDDDEVAVLFAGRLSVGGKAHPYATFSALQAAQAETGRKLVLILAGRTFNEAGAAAIQAGLQDYCPDVRAIVADGGELATYRRAWAGADIFMSLADSIQETFGITPVEAMACGLPALVSDWNGYKDTVRDGVDGFRIRTWAPAPGAGASVAEDFEIGALDYDQYLSRSNTAVVVDLQDLGARLAELINDPHLRRRMGEAGRARAREIYDWLVVFRRYQALWEEQTTLRTQASKDPWIQDWIARAPRAAASHLGPFDPFASFPSSHVVTSTIVSRGRNGNLPDYRSLVSQTLTGLWVVPEPIVSAMLATLDAGPATVEALAKSIGLSINQTTELVARLAKIDVLRLEPGHSSPAGPTSEAQPGLH